MRNRFLTQLAAVTVGLLLTSSTVVAKPNGFRIPDHAKKLAPNVYSLGTAKHKGKTVEGLLFVYRGNARPDNPGGGNANGNGGGNGGRNGGGNGGGGDTNSKCYSVLAKGAKWKTPEDWVINTANISGLSGSFLLSTTDAAYDEWEAEAGGADIVGEGFTTTDTLEIDEDQPDDLNEIYFGSIAEPGVIAVTITWGIYGGNPNNRVLVEMDQLYDQVDYAWSATGEAGKMDYENIAQHEIGHAIGMGHAPETTDCLDETMYPTASFAETSKRDLNAGDIAGINTLY